MTRENRILLTVVNGKQLILSMKLRIMDHVSRLLLTDCEERL